MIVGKKEILYSDECFGLLLLEVLALIKVMVEWILISHGFTVGIGIVTLFSIQMSLISTTRKLEKYEIDRAFHSGWMRRMKCVDCVLELGILFWKILIHYTSFVKFNVAHSKFTWLSSVLWWINFWSQMKIL